MPKIRILSSMTIALVSVSIAGPAQTGVNVPGKTSAEKSADGQIRCRKVEVISSLVKKGYVCETKAQWREIIDSGNRVARSFLETGQICSSGVC